MKNIIFCVCIGLIVGILLNYLPAPPDPASGGAGPISEKPAPEYSFWNILLSPRYIGGLIVCYFLVQSMNSDE